MQGGGKDASNHHEMQGGGKDACHCRIAENSVRENEK